MAAPPVFRINADAEFRRETISAERHCIVADNFLKDPQGIVEYAANRASEFSVPERAYPGLQLAVDRELMTDIYRFLRSTMTEHFPFLRGGMEWWSFLSMVTFRPDELLNLHRLCHTDPNPDPGRSIYAGLIYLFENEALGGTSFYRWRHPEVVDEAAAIDRDDPHRALEFLQEQFPTFREQPRYLTESNEFARLLLTIPARFNRLIFYPGDMPHSGAITAPELLSGDCRKGRLTLNLFASVLPK